MEFLSKRLYTWWSILARRPVAIVLAIFGGIGTWDTLQSQVLPEEVASRTVRTFELLGGLPWWSWMPIGLSVLLVVILEGAFHEIQDIREKNVALAKELQSAAAELDTAKTTQAALAISVAKETIRGMDWHRVQIRNTSRTAQARDVAVKLHRIEPDPLSFNPYPGRLGKKGGGTEHCYINPGDHELFDFVRDTKQAVYQLFTVEFLGHEFTLIEGDYRVTISASAANADQVCKTFIMRQPFTRNEKNYLELAGDLEFFLEPDSVSSTQSRNLYP